MGTDGSARVAPERRLHPSPLADLPTKLGPTWDVAMANVSESSEPTSREQRRRKAAAKLLSGLRFRPTESFSSQARRVGFGGFPEDPEKVAKLHPLLKLSRLEESVQGLRSSREARAGTKKPKPPRLKMPWMKYFDTAGLTERQSQCALLKLQEELSTSQIARRLHLHRKTVHEHLQRAMTKMERSKVLRKHLHSQGIPRR